MSAGAPQGLEEVGIAQIPRSESKAPAAVFGWWIAMENGHLYFIYRLKMAIFHSYVSLPEGIGKVKPTFYWRLPVILTWNPN
jgi:hypothetical protein